jgi:hypothetical protein
MANPQSPAPVELNCQLELPKEAQAAGLTVGERMLLSCTGDVGLGLKENTQVVFAKDQEDQQYTLHVLQNKEMSSTAMALVVTSYKPGDYKEQKVLISDGSTTFQTSPLSWKVSSVLKPNEEPKPIPSKGPFDLAYPVWLWLAAAVVVLFLAAVIGGLTYKRKRMKRLQAELDSFKTMLSPYAEFSKEMRIFRRKVSGAAPASQGSQLVEELSRHFRLFLIRELNIHALQLSDREILQALKKRHRLIYEAFEGNFRKVLAELADARVAGSVTARDAEDLFHLVRKLGDGVFEMHRQSRRERGA